VSGAALEAVAVALRSGEPSALLLGGTATRTRGLAAASRVAAGAGAKILCETFPARLERGAGVPVAERVAYFAEFAAAQLGGLRHLVLVEAAAPVSFFAYPGRPSELVPEGCAVQVLALPGDDGAGALESLADALGAPRKAAVAAGERPAKPTGELTPESVAQAIGALLPEGAIVSDEGATAGVRAFPATAAAPPHDWLCLTGGAIGQGLPLGTGAAVACPGRRVLCLEADGSAMYTPQALWTQAREGLDVTTVILNNRSYAILNVELSRVGAEPPGPRAKDMLDLSRPDLDFVALARGLGVPASRATSADDLAKQLEQSFAEPGPHLIEALLPVR
jgi:acetolactate synthase-1/2/3 large subunit